MNEWTKREILVNVGLVACVLVCALIGFQCFLYFHVNLAIGYDRLLRLSPLTVAVALASLAQTAMLFMLAKFSFRDVSAGRLFCWAVLASFMLTTGLFVACSAVSWYLNLPR